MKNKSSTKVEERGKNDRNNKKSRREKNCNRSGGISSSNSCSGSNLFEFRTKNITIEVIDNEQKSTVYELNTDAEFLRDAMEEAEGLEFTGTESEYGLMVESVNGVVADFSVDCSYWGFYVDGEYCMSGIDTQPVENGQAFQIIYTID